jgi:serine/threonine protein kinase
MLQDPEADRGRTRTIPEDVAAEYLARKSEGQAVRLEDYLARMPNAATRKAFEDLVAGAGTAERGLPRAIAAGSKIAGRYRILKKIGEGGMGRVFSAYDEKLGREVALKMLAPLAEGNREREEMFAKEWRLLADLKHPGIVAVHDAGNDGEFTYIVMDLVEGTAISDVIENARTEIERETAAGRRPKIDGELLARAIGREVAPGRRELVDPHDWHRSCARILLEIAQTLEAAHGRKVIHRDLKPANVMLLGGGAPVVLDFGLAGSPDHARGDVTEGLYGSVAYLAPEQARSQKVGMDPRTDVYQLGLILYEMLTLKRAFPGTAVGDVLDRIEHGMYATPRKIVASVPRDLEAICTMALEVSPDRRYASATALREDLERWLEGRAPIASRSARWRSFARTARYTGRKHPVFASMAGMLVVAALAWRIFTWGDPGLPTNFFKMIPSGGKYAFVPIHQKTRELEVGDLVGFTLRSAGDVQIYALSVFGPADGARFVSPWAATNSKDLDRVLRGKRELDPWGFHVVAPVEQVVCMQMRPNPSDYDGLLVLVSPNRLPVVEKWMDKLLDAQGSTGVPFETARDLLIKAFTPETTRGPDVSPNGKEFGDVNREEIIKCLQEARERETRKLGLPGVEEFAIECRVSK